mmetsp:Transcript_50837/g.115635  ORF Transcript_50837/g.115635 Transcript_50837/m.115635 type:complete len:203 (+) Transcript_50837:1179-1787(+)
MPSPSSSTCLPPPCPHNRPANLRAPTPPRRIDAVVSPMPPPLQLVRCRCQKPVALLNPRRTLWGSQPPRNHGLSVGDLPACLVQMGREHSVPKACQQVRWVGLGVHSAQSRSTEATVSAMGCRPRWRNRTELQTHHAKWQATFPPHLARCHCPPTSIQSTTTPSAAIHQLLPRIVRSRLLDLAEPLAAEPTMPATSDGATPL